MGEPYPPYRFSPQYGGNCPLIMADLNSETLTSSKSQSWPLGNSRVNNGKEETIRARKGRTLNKKYLLFLIILSDPEHILATLPLYPVLKARKKPSLRPWSANTVPDHEDFPDAAEKVPPLDLRTRNIIPSLEWVLDKPVPCCRSVMDPLKEKKPRKNLDVEGPVHPKGRTEHQSQSLGVPENLRSALGIVDGQPDREACAGGKYPSNVMTKRIPPDVTPEQQNP